MPDFVVNAATDLHERIGKGVAAMCEILTIIPAKVQAAIVPLLDTADMPCIFCTWDTETEQQDMDFEGNMDKYPIKVGMFDRADLRDQTNRARYLAWRKAMMDGFRPLNTLGPLVPEVWNIEVKPEYIFNPELPAYMHLVSGFTVYASAWEQRPKL